MKWLYYVSAIAVGTALGQLILNGIGITLYILTLRGII